MFRFREVCEIKDTEKNLQLNAQKKEEGFLKIKPEKELSEKELTECVKFWFNEFAKEAQANNPKED